MVGTDSGMLRGVADLEDNKGSVNLVSGREFVELSALTVALMIC